MKIPPAGKLRQNFAIVGLVSIFLSLLLFTLILYVYVLAKNKPVEDTALSNQQVLDKAQVCHKKGMAIQLIYDDEWKVYAVKCVYGGFTGDGRLKK